ncbi:hypothetical protein SADUNF_Sadunf19G0004700 [Salix dunnii]|uniref:Uncharacterized protein n=1 Tax=Salix dunnii TaxID=1413687 RepID=A0A835MKJ8_9ROSI|nr:hypothetical protein SADUNF_Sadunf19G0004700 [Salix dunnii]
MCGRSTMEGVPPSFMEDDVNQLDLETFNMSELLLSPMEEVPVNQSSMLYNDQAGQNILMGNDVDSIRQTTQFPTPFPETMTTMGGLDGTSSSWINQIGLNWRQTPSSDQQWTNQLAMSNQLPGMLPQPPMNQWSPQFPPCNLQVSGDHNQGQVDQASVIPHKDNMQQESLMSLNFGRSTRSQMDNLQIRGLQNRAARPNASNADPDSSLQSQDRGLNTQQVRTLTELSPIVNCLL